ncbi:MULTISPECIES: glucokinase [unclassified Paracoccus (in: a-proteobacteria)]|uniref:glucokinase n=1 Tax=unclassified Paracoccus (in: a-proteobacteria) TaxID=2688777 RepID=UPI0012B395AF|nr:MULTISPECIES: glucokinase [unclassified Paracoccus (in: a-proteobacteria)]UXU75856.1 glucokinase [Paracoccus sp. SMMA_5]UXU81765.1 glucokinase [Paracoccus sp. SMMA_5_TC]
MAKLLADVGGTNARLALARDGKLDAASITRFRGDDHPSFDEVVTRYLDAQGRPAIDAVCVAVAGPVWGDTACLTNRDWTFSEAGLCALTGAPRARLINDMIALGYATPALEGAAAAFLRQPRADARRNGQRLVVNAGTGFNVCAVKVLAQGGIACLESEEGHTRLPMSIADPLFTELGAAARAIDSVEELFAGRGLARLHGLRTGTQARRAEDVVTAAARGDGAAEDTLRLHARLLGLMCRELALRFMPLDGMFLAGSVARSCAYRFDSFEQGLLADPLMARIAQSVPVGVIQDDLAALHGCLAAVG